jgi:hypothetical protein
VCGKSLFSFTLNSVKVNIKILPILSILVFLSLKLVSFILLMSWKLNIFNEFCYTIILRVVLFAFIDNLKEDDVRCQ